MNREVVTLPCLEMGCLLGRQISESGFSVQHGVNPEHTRFFSWEENDTRVRIYVHGPNYYSLSREEYDWLLELHGYGLGTGAPESTALT